MPESIEKILGHPAERFLNRAKKLNGTIVPADDYPMQVTHMAMAFGNYYKTQEGNGFIISQESK